ncbi:MAG: methyl-accepting chemotaxis protein [Myxococcales bacterium]
MNPPSLHDLTEFRSRLIKEQFRDTSGLALVAAYVLSLRLGGDLQVRLVFGAAVVGLYCLMMAVQYGLIGRALAAATATVPDEAAGVRLKRLLEVPARLAIAPVVIWPLGGLIFGIGSALYFGQGLPLVIASTVVWLVAAVAPAPAMFALFDEELRPLAIEEFRRCGTRVAGHGLRWVRQRWLLPSAFVIALGSLLFFSSMALSSLLEASNSSAVARVAERDAELAQQVGQALTGTVAGAMLPVAAIAGFLAIAFAFTGYNLANKQGKAASAIERSMRALVAGTPEPPDWISTDELGDLSFATYQIAAEMQHIFTQLKAMAGGDLRVEIHGDSGLLRAFQESRRGLLRLAEMMVALSRGELGERPDLAGELGRCFGELHAALKAIGDQAQKIAQGDLRLDVEVPGALGDSIRQMSQNLRSMVGQSQTGSAALSDLVVNLQGAASQLSAATTEQASALTETANTMTEMAQTSAASADRAAELIKQGESAATVVGEGNDAARSAIAATTAVAQALTKVAGSSSALAERVRLIDSIAGTVGFLADQSSTLAINAAIEAARAGDAGKGFSVVAHENPHSGQRLAQGGSANPRIARRDS